LTKVYLDIETVPPDRDEPVLRDLIAQKSDADFRKLSLDARYGRVLCIGLIVEGGGGETLHRGVLGRDRETGMFHCDEGRTLRAFWRLLAGFDPRCDMLIGWNLFDFDMHWLMTRSVIKSVRPSFDVSFARYRSRPMFDLMWEFSHWRTRCSLDETAQVLNLRSPKADGVDGSKVYDLFLAGEHARIADYCLGDVECARAIYRRLTWADEGAGSSPPAGAAAASG
jgi:3'-5' exonuclease